MVKMPPFCIVTSGRGRRIYCIKKGKESSEEDVYVTCILTLRFSLSLSLRIKRNRNMIYDI